MSTTSSESENYEAEFADGTSYRWRSTHAQAWKELERLESLGLDVKSTWRNGEPWTGRCTEPEDT